MKRLPKSKKGIGYPIPFKIDLKMRLAILCFLLPFLGMQAKSSFAQKTIALNVKGATVFSLLENIERSTDYRFIYRVGDVDLTRNLSLDVKREEIPKVLDEIFDDSNVEYRIIDNSVFLNKRINLSFMATPVLFKKKLQQQIEITGTVTDEDGVPLSGANVIEEGTSNGVTTDFDGNFSIEVEDVNSVLQISFLGYEEKSVPLNGQYSLSIELKEDASGLDEVVVVGYGSQRKKDLTGSVSSVSADQLEREPSTRIDQALAGRVSGVQITNADSSPGGEIEIRIRGGNSVFGSNDPLIVVDGFIGGKLENISPEDIEAIDILKDASATAIYGSRGANGVVLLTTKAGKGKTKIEYNAFLTSQNILRKVDLLNAEEYAIAVNEYRDNNGGKRVFSDSEIDEFARNGGTDWQDEIFRTTLLKKHHLSISGAGEDVRYYISGSYFDQPGILKNTNLRRSSLRTNIRGNLGDKFSFGVNSNFSHRNGNVTEIGDLAEKSATTAAQQWSPTLPVRRDDGSFTEAEDLPGQTKSPNPYATATEPARNRAADDFNFNAYLEYKIIEGLSIRSSLGGFYSRSNYNQYFPRTTYQGTPAGLGSIANFNDHSLLNTNIVSYEKEFNNHSFTVTGIAEFQRDVSTESFMESSGFVTDALGYNNFVLGSNQQPSTSAKSERTMNSYAARLQYSFADKYMFTASYRVDGSSVLSSGNKYKGFPAIAGGWVVSEEDFLSESNFISYLKLRAGWGTSGSQSIPSNSSLQLLQSGQDYPFDGESLTVGLAPYTLGNPDLTWERTDQINLGVDLDLFNNRVSLAVDFYNKNTKDLLLERQLPLFSSFAPILSNLGRIQNRGVDLGISANVIEGSDFSWSTGVTFSKNSNKVKDLGGEEKVNLGGAGITGGGSDFYQLRMGGSLGDMYGYVYDGVWKSDETTEAASYGSAVGGRKYRDINGDGKIDSKDITKIGSALPDFTYGWTNTISYKNISLDFLFQGSQGNDIFNKVRVRSDQSNSDGFGTGGRIRDRFVPGVNEDTDVAGLGIEGQSLNQSSEYIENGSYFRLKNITLAYTFPKSIIGKTGMNQLRVYVGAQNLFTIDSYSGYDPEVNTEASRAGNSFDRNTRLGIDGGGYPSTRSFTVGIDIGF